jgi:hypothetical protein
MNIDPNNDIVPILRLFGGLMMGNAADEIELLRKRENELTELLRSACCIAERKGEDTAWERFSNSVKSMGIGSMTARNYKTLPSDEG